MSEVDDALEHVPYLTAEAPAVPAVFKLQPEDFRVDELALEEPSGEGEHLLVRIKKTSMSTAAAIDRIARALGLNGARVGYAGLKDARAVTTQWISLPGVEPARALELELRGIEVLEAVPHRRALRRGRLAGNSFRVRLRGVDPARQGELGETLAELQRRGVPNAFGPQRFGRRGDSWRIGAALLAGDWSVAVGLLCGTPTEADTGHVLHARTLFEEGRWDDAARAMPRFLPEARRVARGMAGGGGDAEAALRSLNQRERRFYLSAWQARLFNRVLAARLAPGGMGIDTLQRGDLAWKHDSGAVFRVEDPAAEAARASAFEISPTGPLPGPGMLEPGGSVGALERQALGKEVDLVASGDAKGVRRALRFQVRESALDAGQDGSGDHLELRFTLDSGCYATSLLRELCKQGLVEGGRA